MNVNKCDRCGKRYQSEYDSPKIRGIVALDAQRNCKVLEGHEYGRIYGLCDDCVNDFEKWWGQGNGNT